MFKRIELKKIHDFLAEKKTEEQIVKEYGDRYLSVDLTVEDYFRMVHFYAGTPIPRHRAHQAQCLESAPVLQFSI